MINIDDSPIPGVSDKALGEVVAGFADVPLTDAEDADRFMREIRRLAEARAQLDWPNEVGGAIAVFVMVDRPRQIEAKLRSTIGKATKVLDLRANSTPLFGRLFILNNDGSNGFFIALPSGENAILEWLEDNGFLTNPVALLWRETHTLALRRSGPADSAQYENVRVVPPEATIEELLRAISRFHERRLLTPGDCDGVWEKGRAGQYVPGKEPEKAIQNALRFALDFWFHDAVKAETEDSTSVGRIDVRLLTTDPQSKRLGYWAIIELKVFRSYHNAQKGQKLKPVSSKANVDAMKEGLMQIHTYKTDREAPEGLLEIYDLRKDKKADISKVKEIKALRSQCDPSIQVHIRPLYGSDKDYRKSQFSSA